VVRRCRRSDGRTRPHYRRRRRRLWKVSIDITDVEYYYSKDDSREKVAIRGDK